jgi:pimeloyl-ACP methyl ester carboxylesterase
MPYANNRGVRIHYKVEGAGPPLVLQHGFTDSLESWYERGYVAALKGDHQLVLIDARGHGTSDKPHDTAAYAMQHHAADVAAVLKALSIPKAYFFGYSIGYSMGGDIGYALAKYAPTLGTAFIIGGSSPYKLNREFQEPMLQMLKQGVETLVDVWEGSGLVTPSLKARLGANDMEALTALWTMRMEEEPHLEDALPKLRQPCLLLVGEEDGLRAEIETMSKRLPKGKFVAVPGIDHLKGFLRSDLTIPHIKRFLATLPRPGVR